MLELNIPLDDLVLDPDNPLDFGSLSKEEIKTLVEEAYSFLNVPIEVKISDSTAHIRIQTHAEPTSNAERLYERAIKHAKQGNYKRAIKVFQEALNESPAYAEARRNLGMAYLEIGDTKRAKKELLYTLRLDPTNSWGFLLLGNLYAKHERDLKKAEELYSRAYELDPKDPFLLTNLGALSVETGRTEEAKKYFEQALDMDPRYPNAYYGLALLHKSEGNITQALATLEKLFVQPVSTDKRRQPVYAEARNLYLELNKQLAEKTYASMMEVVEKRKQELEAETGVPIEIQEDLSLKSVFAVAEAAWRHKRGYHRIRYRKITPGLVPHLIAHELEHLHMEEQARSAGRNRFFATTAETRKIAIQAISKHINRLSSMGYPEAKIASMTTDLINGLAQQLHSCPLDMVVEQHLYQDLEEIRPSQFLSLYANHMQSLKAFEKKEIRKLTPPKIYRASVTLNAAYALFVDSLYGGATDYASAYRNFEGLSTAQRLFTAWQDMMKNFQPGDEYELVDTFARVLKLEGWFEWKPDVSGPSRPEGTTNPELLKAKEPAAVMYCLDALERFDSMSKNEIFRIGAEIALLGANGIDYASSDPQYTLHSIPGRKFTGLHLLALMYVAFKITDPSVNLGLDLEEAYNLALKLHSQAGRAN